MACVTYIQSSMDNNTKEAPADWDAPVYWPPHMDSYMNEAVVWADRVKEAMTIFQKCTEPSPIEFVSSIGDEDLLSLPLDKIRLDESLAYLPRRRKASDDEVEKANTIANLLYPAPRDSLGPIIKYEKDRARIRGCIRLQKRWDILHATKLREQRQGHAYLRVTGPWNLGVDPISLHGPPSVPMPVKVSTAESLKPFFEHLRNNGNSHGEMGTLYSTAQAIEEPFYHTQALEFPRGVVYADGRMDLCKMVVGPPHIGDLVDSLRANTFIKHILLGNNLIGPMGARKIASFVKDFPDRIDTWYLAGNCIDGISFSILVEAFITSTAITNIWLKRNPLGSNAATDLFRLITETPNLRTLDLDQAELGDAGVADLFSMLKKDSNQIALENIYLNGNGIGPNAASAIGGYLGSEHCSITSLYMSNNPLGDEGAANLALMLKNNSTLKRLSLRSAGLSDGGAKILTSSLQNHPKLTFLDLGQSFAAQDLGQAYNYLTNDSSASIATFLTSCQTLECLNIGSCAMTHKGMSIILQEASNHPSLLQLNMSSIHSQSTDPISIRHGQEHARLSKLVQQRVRNNVTRKHSDTTYEEWQQNEKRWLVSDELDVRKIDSVYRTRDMALARKGKKQIDKWWGEDDTTLEEIRKDAVGPVCTMRKGNTGV